MRRADRHSDQEGCFDTQPLSDVYATLARKVANLATGDTLSFTALDPDLHPGAFAGEIVEHVNEPYRHRDHSTWMELAEALGCSYQTPRMLEGGKVQLRFRKLPHTSWHDSCRPSGDSEKYGVDTEYTRIDRFEQPAFLSSWRRALRFLQLAPSARVLSLGCNRGRELAHVPHTATAVGIDHSASCIDAAQEAFPDHTFLCRDIGELAHLSLGSPFDLVIAINTLHATGIDTAGVLRHLVAERLTPDGRLLIGLPNSRHRFTTLTYGTQAKNRRGPELTPLMKDAMFIRRYLNQHRFDVRIMGKHNVLVAARRRVNSSI